MVQKRLKKDFLQRILQLIDEDEVNLQYAVAITYGLQLLRSLIGMISHKKSLITIFGQKHEIKNFIKKFDIFHEKISTAFGFLFIFGIKLLILKQNYIKIISKFWTKWQL